MCGTWGSQCRPHVRAPQNERVNAFSLYSHEQHNLISWNFHRVVFNVYLESKREKAYSLLSTLQILYLPFNGALKIGAIAVFFPLNRCAHHFCSHSYKCQYIGILTKKTEPPPPPLGTGFLKRDFLATRMPGVSTPPTNLCGDKKIASLYADDCWLSLQQQTN